MLGRDAAYALVLSDVGKVISRENYDKVDADDYVMHEDGEEIFFLIKSKADEYCFTNKALIHVDGESATSKKRKVKRFSYYRYAINDVWLETAGRLDMDVELKFRLGEMVLSLDVKKEHLEALKDLYKSLIKISEIKEDAEHSLEAARSSLQLASDTLSHSRNEKSAVVDDFKELNMMAFNWLRKTHEKYHIKDFGFVFKRYINN